MLKGEVKLPDQVDRLSDAELDSDGDVIIAMTTSKAKKQKKGKSKAKGKVGSGIKEADDDKVRKKKQQPKPPNKMNSAAPCPEEGEQKVEVVVTKQVALALVVDVDVGEDLPGKHKETLKANGDSMVKVDSMGMGISTSVPHSSHIMSSTVVSMILPPSRLPPVQMKTPMSSPASKMLPLSPIHSQEAQMIIPSSQDISGVEDWSMGEETHAVSMWPASPPSMGDYEDIPAGLPFPPHPSPRCASGSTKHRHSEEFETSPDKPCYKHARSDSSSPKTKDAGSGNSAPESNNEQEFQSIPHTKATSYGETQRTRSGRQGPDPPTRNATAHDSSGSSEDFDFQSPFQILNPSRPNNPSTRRLRISQTIP
jgi:hypothetical protein